jgi:predicted O-methyltransferase YrrM
MSARQYLIEDGIFDIRLKFLEDRSCLYRPFLRPRTVEAMNSAIFGEGFAGATDMSALSVMAMFCAICQPSRVVELGTYRGFSTLILADILSTNQRAGRIVTVEPTAAAQESAKRCLEAAGLSGSVQFVSGFSLDRHVLDQLQRQAPYDMIYIDTSHEYKPTLGELQTYLVDRPMIRPGGMVFLHDISFPMTNDRGVGGAVADWVVQHPEYRYLPLTTDGLWPNPCGLGILLTPQSGGKAAVA